MLKILLVFSYVTLSTNNQEFLMKGGQYIKPHGPLAFRTEHQPDLEWSNNIDKGEKCNYCIAHKYPSYFYHFYRKEGGRGYHKIEIGGRQEIVCLKVLRGPHDGDSVAIESGGVGMNFVSLLFQSPYGIVDYGIFVWQGDCDKNYGILENYEGRDHWLLPQPWGDQTSE